MNDAAVVEEIEPDLVEQTDVEETELEDVVDEEEASEAEEVEEADEEPSESSPEKKDDSFQDRIDELTGKYRSEERARIEAETRYQQAQQQLQAMEKPKPIEPDKTLADFDYDEGKYAEYVTEVAREAAQKQAVEIAQQELEQKRTAERQAQFAVRESDFKADLPDYELMAYSKAVITPEMADVIRGAEKGPEIAYYLGQNVEVGAKLAAMHPLDMAREIGHIESTLVKPEKKESKTPPPPPKLKAGNAPTRITSDSPDSDKLSDAEWLRRERKRLAAKDK